VYIFNEFILVKEENGVDILEGTNHQEHRKEGNIPPLQ
jgi:hypothetical protein